MGYFEVLKLPVKTFWALNKQVGRLRAEEDQRDLGNLSASQSAEGYKARMEALQREIGAPTVVEKSFDEAAFLRLQAKMVKGA